MGNWTMSGLRERPVRDRTRRRRLFPALAALTLFVGVGAGTMAIAVAQEPDSALEAEFDRIAAGTASLRELPPLAEIRERFQTPEELRLELPMQIAEDYPLAEAAAESRSWAALGLVPAGSDLIELFVDLLGDQVAGYYDPRTNEMVVISEGAEFGALEEFTYSHETVHALQDEHLGLGDLILEEGPSLSDDASVALTALYEGDATLASFDYLSGDPGLAARVAFAAGTQAAPLDGPPALTVWLIFPYLQGPTFVHAVRDAGGWAAVDAAYADPPVSTEQVMHPEKYLERDEPVAVSLPEATALGEDWSEVDQDTLGELLTAVVLANLQPGQGFNEFMGTLDLPTPASQAAAGWGGDRYALWENGEQEVLVWRSVWDTEEDARAFAGAMQGYAAARFGETWSGSIADATMLGTNHAARLSLTGTTVQYTLAPTPELAESAMDVLGQN